MTYYFLDSNHFIEMGGHSGGRRLPRELKHVHCKNKKCRRELISVIDKDVLCDDCIYARTKEQHKKAREELEKEAIAADD